MRPQARLEVEGEAVGAGWVAGGAALVRVSSPESGCACLWLPDGQDSLPVKRQCASRSEAWRMCSQFLCPQGRC